MAERDREVEGQGEVPTTLQEGYKSMVDTAKHLTTLCTASIVILATYLNDVFGGTTQTQEWRLLVPAIFAGFAMSLLLAAIVAYFVPLRLITPAYRRSGEVAGAPNRALYRLQDFEYWVSISVFWCYRLSLLAFSTGVVLLAIFAGKNLA